MKMIESISRKARESARVLEELAAKDSARIEACARSLAERFRAGGRLFAFGNGGSACDAQHVALEFSHPIIEKRRALPAIALVEAPVLTAIGNDTDFSNVYAEQLRVHARAGDVAVGISTSGKSPNVARGLAAARELGLITVALAGKDGGKLPALVEHCFLVPSFSIHRIQEGHVLLLHVLWDCVHLALGEEDVI